MRRFSSLFLCASLVVWASGAVALDQRHTRVMQPMAETTQEATLESTPPQRLQLPTTTAPRPAKARAAEPSEDDDAPALSAGNASQHEASALQFAKRKNWGEALGHAKASGSSALRSLISWMWLKDRDTVADSSAYAPFLKHPTAWPDADVMLYRAQKAMLLNGASDGEIRNWWKAALRLGKATAEEGTSKAEFIRHGWRELNLSPHEEDQIVARHRAALGAADHKARAERQLYDGNSTAAARMLPLLSSADRAELRAAIAIATGSPNGTALYAALSKAQRRSEAVLFGQLVQARAQKNDKATERLLLAAPAQLTHPDAWWRARASVVRDAIEAGNYRHAEKLLAGHSLTTGEAAADALFLEGWLLLEFRNKAKDAYKKFYSFYNAVKYPVSKAKAAYWAGLAAEKNGNHDIAKNWFTQGAAYPTQFYGQLSHLQLHGNAPLALPPSPKPTKADRASAARLPSVAIMRILLRQNETMLADKFMGQGMDHARTPGKIAAIAEMAQEAGGNYLKVKAAKRALRNNVLLARTGWPTLKVPFSPVIEPALMFAITRQESEFRSTARSTANAIGMMQLLPKTAAHTAAKNGIRYKRESDLLNPAYNMQLGAHYLGGLLSKYDGNLMLAIAAYNAGPKNVNSWLGRFGTPGKSVPQTLRWLEQIPFSETRNYVQRVMENLQVYRAILGSYAGKTRLALGDDLAHTTVLRDLPQE